MEPEPAQRRRTARPAPAPAGPARPWPFSQIPLFLDYLVCECGLSANTIQAYGRDLERFGAYCHHRQLNDPQKLTADHLQGYARDLSRKSLASSTVARHLVTLRMFLRFHVLSGLLLKDFFSLLEAPKTWRRLPGVLSRERTNRLIEAVDPDGAYRLRDRALLELLYATGMRAAEAAELRCQDVNFQVGYLRCIGKGRKERIIPVHDEALRLLQEYLEQLRPQLLGEKSCPQVFVSRTGRPLSRIEIWRIVRKAALAAGLQGKVTPHTLRHCFGSHLLQGGADLRSVQEMLGHADVTTTQIYTHVDQEHLRRIHKQFHPRP
ncbi:MAG: site-specific tyrosine recombinase XerD [Sedimentisphaerales bacterium]|nr:site-specific tyrosine recombinase XerD [Sedimentisphaerales bacterium]